LFVLLSFFLLAIVLSVLRVISSTDPVCYCQTFLIPIISKTSLLILLNRHWHRKTKNAW